MTINKRIGYDWKCEAPDCESVLTHSSDRVPPDDFVTVHLHRGDSGPSKVGHACSAPCAGALAQELFVLLHNLPEEVEDESPRTQA